MQKNFFSSKELQVIQQAKLLNALVIGDSCIDRFIYGNCNRLSPEAPVPILEHVTTEEMPGMAGNVAENLSAFTEKVFLQAQVSKIEKIRYVDAKSNQHIMRFDIEPSEVEESEVFTFKNNLIARRASLGDFNIVIISDYDKGFISSEQAALFTESINQNIYVDSKKKDLSCFKKSIIKLNQKEYNNSRETISNCSEVIQTLGSSGAMYNGNLYPAETVEVFDVSGAGDTFIASFAVYHSITDNIPESIEFANKCSSIVVQRKGTYALSEKDIT